MIQNELFINDERLDLSDEKGIAVSYQINNLADLQDRQSTYSQTIKLPKTANNKRLFGYADSDTFTQSQPYQKNTGKLVQSGVETIPYGQITLQQVTDFFEAQLTTGLVGINDLLSITSTDILTGLVTVRDAKIADLDYSDIPNFGMTLADKVANLSIFPVIDYGGTVDASSTINTSYLRPGIYYYQIINRIQAFLGYTFSGSILSDSTYLNDFIPFSATVLYDFEGTNWLTTGLPISVAKNIPDFTIKDFLKDFMQRYFLTPVVDNYKRTLEFHSFDELYANKSNPYDWTDKFIDDARTDEFALPGYSQVNQLLWKKDQLYLTNGNGVISVNNQTLPLTSVAATSIFAASGYTTGVLGGQTVALIKKFPVAPLPSSGVVPTIDTEVRIVNIKPAASGAYAFTDGTATTIVTSGVKSGEFWDQTNGIGYDYQLQKYGQGLLKLLEKCRIITRYVLLKPIDLYKFNFFKPVYDAKEAKYYYVNQISNYVNGDKCKVSLIRM